MGLFQTKKFKLLIVVIIALAAIVWLFQDNLLQTSFFRKPTLQKENIDVTNKGRAYIEKIDNFSINEYSDNEKIIYIISADQYYSYKNSPIELFKVRIRTFDDVQKEAAILTSNKAQILETSEIIFNGNVNIETLNNMLHELQSESITYKVNQGEISSNDNVIYQGISSIINSNGMLMSINDDKLLLIDSVNIKEESGAEIETSNLTINQSNGLKLYQSNEKTIYRSLDNKITTKSGVIIDMEKNLTNLLGKVEILKSSGTKIFTSDLIIDKSNSKEIYRTKQLSNYVSIKSNIKANQMYYDVLSEKIDLSGGVVAIYE